MSQNKDHFKRSLDNIGVLSTKSITLQKDSGPYITIPFEGPYLIKPAKLDNSIALLPGKENIAQDKKQAVLKAIELSKLYDSPMMVEEFIEGYDISNPYARFDEKFHITAIREMINEEWKDSGYQPNVLKDTRAKSMIVAEDKDLTEIKIICQKIIHFLELRSYGRFDFRRCTSNGKLYLLELNPGTSLTGKQYELFYEMNHMDLAGFIEKMIIQTMNDEKNKKNNSL